MRSLWILSVWINYFDSTIFVNFFKSIFITLFFFTDVYKLMFPELIEELCIILLMLHGLIFWQQMPLSWWIVFAPDNVLILISKLSQTRRVVHHFKKLCPIILSCFSDKVVKTTSIYMRQYVKLYFTIVTKLLRKKLSQKLFCLDESCHKRQKQSLYTSNNK